MAKAGKRKWLRPGAKITIPGDGCWEGEKRGEVVRIENGQVLVRVTEEFWVHKGQVEQRE
jgi:hypothetical protein